jgi:hypothetical protein
MFHDMPDNPLPGVRGLFFSPLSSVAIPDERNQTPSSSTNGALCTER